MNSTTTVQTQLPQRRRVSLRRNTSACRNAPTRAVGDLTTYLRDLARVGDGECFFWAMGGLAAGAKT